MQSANLDFKVNRQELYRRVAAKLKNDTSDEINFTDDVFTIPVVCNALFDEIENIVCSGGKVSLTGFGSFFGQIHKGHPVQFGNKVKNVEDYRVFKFSASNVLNERLRSS